MPIRLKLIIIFLAIAAIPLLLVSGLTYTNFKHSLEENRLAQLNDLSVFRAERIDAYFTNLKAGIEIAQGFYIIKKNLSVLNKSALSRNNAEFMVYKKALGDQLKHVQKISNLSDIMLVDLKGAVVYSNRPIHSLKKISTGSAIEQKTFERGKLGVFFSDIFFDSLEDRRSEMLVSAPAMDFNDTLRGVIVFEVDMTPVYGLIQDVTGLGATGEVLIGKKNGDQVVFLNPLRHDPSAALKRKAVLGEFSSFPIQQAVQGKNGSGRAIDYRGEPVIAAWRYIPSLDWGLVAKIDTREAFGDVTNLRDLVFIILIIVLTLSGLMAFTIAESIAGPIKALTRGAGIIGSGNLDYKVGTNLKNEIGRLSRSFDRMTQDLKTTTASRDDLTREIDERKKAQQELSQTVSRLDLLSQSAGELLQTAEPQKIVEALCRKVLEHLDCHVFFNFMVDPGAGRLHLNAFAGITTEDAKKIEWLDYGVAVCGCAAQQGSRIVAEHIPTTPDIRTDLVKSYGVKAYACHPILAGENKVLGTLSFGTRTRETFSPADLSLMKAITDQVAVAMERMQSEKALRMSAEDLARSNKDLEQFAYVASHDLQEPLRAVAGFVELLKQELSKSLTAKTTEYINFSIDGAKRMQALINGLLDYSRINTKGHKPALTDSKAALDEALARLGTSIEESDAIITAGDLPEVYFDTVQLSQLFQNLIGNAIKFRGEKAPAIHIGAARVGNCWRFSVTDNGIGIDAQYADRIFMIFQRLHSREKYPGTGIGLAICKRIVERHNGKIWVEPAAGGGCSFYFTILDKGESSC